MKLRPFELALVVIFLILMVIALFLLRTYTPEQREEAVALGGPVTIWGTLPYEAMATQLEEMQLVNKAYDQVYYTYVSPADFDSKFVNALADGKAPDLLLMSHELLVKHRNRLEAFPYETFPIRDLKSTYVDGVEIFARSNGIYGFPVAVDPLMLYWNRDMFAEANYLTAPTTWEAIVADTVPALTKREFDRTITKSALAMGEYKNIKNAFPIISMLLLQGGSKLITEDGARYSIDLDVGLIDNQSRPLTNAFTFYTNFSTIANTLYSWNRSLPLDRDMFLREDLALYFGYGSEARELEARNPNLNFDIAEVPQGAGATVRRTYGQFYAFFVPKAAPNKLGAYSVMQDFGTQERTKKLADAYGLAPVFRATITAGSNDIFGRVIYATAPMARGWLNPDRVKVDENFSTFLEEVSSNRSTVPNAISDAITRLEASY